ncbi:hypothetical protein Ct61P_07022 [Colletotrichum tofieldiae]|nr:hypothetical protein Ct61P_07022 [Colletotrichum tofieldiae]
MRKPRYVPRGVGEGANAAQAWMGEWWNRRANARPPRERNRSEACESTALDAARCTGLGLGEALWGDEDKAEEGEDDEDEEAAASTTA